MSKQVKKETKKEPTREVAKSSNAPKWTSLGQATYIIAIIFCILESIIAFLLIILYGLMPFTAKQEGSSSGDMTYLIIIAVAATVVALVILIFGITATVIICKRTRAGQHLNLALAICSIIFFNIVVGILATIYSTQVPKNKKSTA